MYNPFLAKVAFHTETSQLNWSGLQWIAMQHWAEMDCLSKLVNYL